MNDITPGLDAIIEFITVSLHSCDMYLISGLHPSHFPVNHLPISLFRPLFIPVTLPSSIFHFHSLSIFLSQLSLFPVSPPSPSPSLSIFLPLYLSLSLYLSLFLFLISPKNRILGLIVESGMCARAGEKRRESSRDEQEIPRSFLQQSE